MLDVRDIYVEYQRDIEILKGVSISVREGYVSSVIGPNGAGKSTLLKTVMGILKPKRGSIIFDGKKIEGKQPNELVKMGLTYVPQRRSIFPQLTVKENLEMGAWTLRKNESEVRRRMREVLELFPSLSEKINEKAGLLSGGQARMLEIARALMTSPKLLLLDEPSFGLSPLMTNKVYETITDLKKTGITILLVDQNLGKCMALSDYVYVIELGSVRGGGKRDEMPADVKEIIRRWLEAEEGKGVESLSAS